MALTHYNAWYPQRLESEIKQVFERFFGDTESESSVVTSQWAPRVDIREEDKRFVILADIPGVEPKDIEISMDKGILSIRGERKAELNEESSTLTRIERSYGMFHRRFALPDSADADRISASGKNGVLEISIPKKPQAAPRKIEITH